MVGGIQLLNQFFSGHFSAFDLGLTVWPLIFITIRKLVMDKDRDQTRDAENKPQSQEEQDRERHNPFKETATQGNEETPEEEAETEQERKEAMTERD